MRSDFLRWVSTTAGRWNEFDLFLLINDRFKLFITMERYDNNNQFKYLIINVSDNNY